MILSALAERLKRRSKDDYSRGTFLCETVDDHAEVLIGTRTYRQQKSELRPAG